MDFKFLESDLTFSHSRGLENGLGYEMMELRVPTCTAVGSDTQSLAAFYYDDGEGDR